MRDGDSTLSTRESDGSGGSGIDFITPISESLSKPGSRASLDKSISNINDKKWLIIILRWAEMADYSPLQCKTPSRNRRTG